MSNIYRITAAPVSGYIRGQKVEIRPQRGVLMYLSVVKKVKMEEGKPELPQQYFHFNNLNPVKEKLVDLFSQKQIFGFGFLSRDEEEGLEEFPIVMFAESNRQKLNTFLGRYLDFSLKQSGNPALRATSFDVYVVRVEDVTPIGGFESNIAKVIYSKGDEKLHSDQDLDYVRRSIETLKSQLQIIE